MLTEHNGEARSRGRPSGVRPLIESPVLAISVLEAVANEFDVDPVVFTSPGRKTEPAKIRHVAMYLLRETTNLSLPQIARYFGRDHTTIMHGIEKIRDSMVADAELASRVLTVKSLLITA